jgi:hypothetical protein
MLEWIDFVQMAWKLLFCAREQFDRFDNLQHFVKFPIEIFCNKVFTETFRRLGTQRHNFQGELPLDRVWQEAIGREPSPVDMSIAANDRRSCCRTDRRGQRKPLSHDHLRRRLRHHNARPDVCRCRPSTSFLADAGLAEFLPATDSRWFSRAGRS